MNVCVRVCVCQKRCRILSYTTIIYGQMNSMISSTLTVISNHTMKHHNTRISNYYLHSFITKNVLSVYLFFALYLKATLFDTVKVNRDQQQTWTSLTSTLKIHLEVLFYTLLLKC